VEKKQLAEHRFLCGLIAFEMQSKMLTHLQRTSLNVKNVTEVKNDP
jgi:hypothetical protein